MSKTVKLVAVVDGEPTPVGRCHPGQARILQKQGLAEWKEGKLWLAGPPDTFVYEDSCVRLEVTRDELKINPLSPDVFPGLHAKAVAALRKARSSPEGEVLSSIQAWGDARPVVKNHREQVGQASLRDGTHLPHSRTPQIEDLPHVPGEPEPELPDDVDALEDLWSVPAYRYTPEVGWADKGWTYYGPCPCGSGIDTDGDGDCPACARQEAAGASEG
jgi:hypothetical protein